MYLTPTNCHWACDIEADDLKDKATRIWCVCVENVETGEKHTFENKESFNDWITKDVLLVGHNFIGYDLPMLNRFWGTGIGVSRIVDTYILSQLYDPVYSGGHSLETWGNRLRCPKAAHDDFSRFSPEMRLYCEQDTKLTALLFRKLTERMRSVGFTETGAEIEHLAWNIIENKQRKNGFPFDEQRAVELLVTLRAREKELYDEIVKLWPPVYQVVRSFKKACNIDGSFSKRYQDHLGQYRELKVNESGGYEAYDFVKFNPGSPIQRIEKLIELGWTPVNFTKKNNPKVDEDELLNYAESSGTPEVAALAKWIVCNSRANMLNTWLNAYNHTTKAIHGKLFLASTMRYKHSSPNSANIPAVRTKKVGDEDVIQYNEDGAWTYECRDLWNCGDPNDWSLVGVDGTGIQNRCLIHHLIETVGEEAVKDFKALALSGDIHKHNINVLGLAHKAAAKKFYYTLMMGGAGKRLAADQAQFGTVLTEAQGTAMKTKMVASIPGFGELIKKLKKELDKTGRIRLCDGTPIKVPSPHMVIPYLLQGDESRLMKKALILVDKEIRRAGLQDKVFKVADIHDEHQYRVYNSVVGQFTEFVTPCFKKAGEFFNYNIQIEADYKVGKTWSETH